MRAQARSEVRRSRSSRGRQRSAVSTAGRSLLAATGQPAKHEPFFPMPDGFRHVAPTILDALEAAIDPTVSAVLIEPVQGEAVSTRPRSSTRVSAGCATSERGMLMIADEIQTGFVTAPAVGSASGSTLNQKARFSFHQLAIFIYNSFRFYCVS